ncbi:hypothetical protein HF329_08940 [Chitinophaga oryzae]|uniref:Uncharacterized protein n=1 Tax=Chitinophaga oryzae TaxID=2725414 RepID=A0AAE6ZED4_9BACT|nr:hypothetical protein [Chitinophaga oryzae]QJB31418.1 hypothetical protein HF329_08940 [Chitinophaga oryzae]
MYFVLALSFLIVCTITYAVCQTGRFSLPVVPQLPEPPQGDDAIADVAITGISDSAFTISRYLRNIRNISSHRFVTVATRQIVRTPIGTTSSIRIIESLAPGDERRLGHTDHVQRDGASIYIGYEILWARYTPPPRYYHSMTPAPPYTGEVDTAELKPGLLYQILLLENQA